MKHPAVKILFLLMILGVVNGCYSSKSDLLGNEWEEPLYATLFRGLFPGMPTPLQINLENLGLFCPVGTTVYGVELNLPVGGVKECYGVSVAPLMNANVSMCGISAGLMNSNHNVYGLSVGGGNFYEENYGVSIGVYNLKLPKTQSGKPKMNLLQIGILNTAESGLQIGLVNYNPNALIPFFPLVNFAPYPE